MEARQRGYKAVETNLKSKIDDLSQTRQLEVEVNTALVDFLGAKHKDLENLTQSWMDKCVMHTIGFPCIPRFSRPVE